MKSLGFSKLLFVCVFFLFLQGLFVFYVTLHYQMDASILRINYNIFDIKTY
jgi:hypothetical protein